MDYLQFIFQAINNLLTQNLGFFDAMGQNLFRAFATILVVWYGVKSALSSAGGSHLLHFDNFASLLLTISFGFGMVNYYSTPIPGIGVSFHKLVTDESQFLANKINQTELQTKGVISTVQLIEAFPVLFITFLASIYALLKIPALTNHIFSGTAGGSSTGIVERVFG